MLADRGKAILISSHILTELAEICNGAVIIEQGKILRAGPMEQIIAGESPHRTIVVRAARRRRRPAQGIAASARGSRGPRDRARRWNSASTAATTCKARSSRTWSARGSSIIDFRQRQIDLEDVFMTVTKGEVQ